LGHQEPDGLHLRNSGSRGDETGRLLIAVSFQDFPAPRAHVQEKGFVIRRVGNIDVVYPHSYLSVSFSNFPLKILSMDQAAWVGEDVDSVEGSLSKQSENRPLGEDTLHQFRIEWISISGKGKKNVHMVIASGVSF